MPVSSPTLRTLSVEISDCLASRMCTRESSGQAGSSVKWPSNVPTELTVSFCACSRGVAVEQAERLYKERLSVRRTKQLGPSLHEPGRNKAQKVISVRWAYSSLVTWAGATTRQQAHWRSL
jgi:hypothetical protein